MIKYIKSCIDTRPISGIICHNSIPQKGGFRCAKVRVIHMLFSECNRKPVMTVMLKTVGRDAMFAEIDRAKEQGADAFGFSAGHLSIEFRSREFLHELFAHIGNYPIYFTNYRRSNRYPELSDDQLAETLLMSVEEGATLIDLPGDFFSPSDGELATNAEAVKKQMQLIDEIHARGAEVLMSSHVLKYIPKEMVLSIALLHKKRGADVSKIVTEANSPEELDDTMDASVLLKRRLGLPYLFLCNGTECRSHRRFGPFLGGSIFLVTEDHADPQNQPRISDAIALYRNIYGTAD